MQLNEINNLAGFIFVTITMISQYTIFTLRQLIHRHKAREGIIRTLRGAAVDKVPRMQGEA